MTYLPGDLINQNYFYNYDNNNKIIVYKNCVSNNCECVDVFPDLDYQIGKIYSCVLSNNNMEYTNFTDNFYYRKDLSSILIIFLILSFFIIYLPINVFSKLFKRRL